MLPSNALPGGGPGPPSRCSGYGSILLPNSSLHVGHGVGDFSINHLGIKLMRSIRRIRVGVENILSQFVQRTRLETFRQSRVVVAVVIVVGAYSPETDNRASRLLARRVVTLGRETILLDIVVPLLAVTGTGDGQSSPIWGSASPPLGGDAPLDEGSPLAPGKGSAGDAAPGEGAAGVSTSLLVRSRNWSTNPCTCRSADTSLAFSKLVGMVAVKSRTSV